MGKSEATQSAGKGLAGVIALETEICDIDGQEGILIYSGYDIGDLAAHCTFEEVAYLLWNGRLPTAEELHDLELRLAAERILPPMVVETLRLMPEDADPMAALRTGVSILSLFDGEANDMSPAANMRKAIRLTARIPVIIAALDRLRKNQELIAPLKDGSTAFNFLYMMTGEKPGEAATVR